MLASPREVRVALVALAFSAASQAGDKDWNAEALHRIVNPPLGLPSLALAEQDEPDVQRIALGYKLFFDRRLSANSSMSCATCHVPAQAFTQNDRPTPKGADGGSLRRNAPSLLNVWLREVTHARWRGALAAIASSRSPL